MGNAQDEANLRRVVERNGARLNPNLGGAESPSMRLIGNFLRHGYVILPFAALFALGSVGYVIYAAFDKRGKPVCVDCARQKQIAEEIYGGAPQRKMTGRMLP